MTLWLEKSRFVAAGCWSASVLIVLALAGCTGGGNALRGVGTPERLQSTSAPVEQTVAKEVAREEKLQAGTPLNITGAPLGEAQPAIAVEVPPTPQMALTRTGAIGEIRTKAATRGTGKPDVFAPPSVPAARMSLAEQEQARVELEAAAAANTTLLPPAEAEAKSAGARKLKRRAQSHYDDAVKAIEN